MKKMVKSLDKLIETQKWNEAADLIIEKYDEVFEIVKESILMKKGTQCLVGILTALSSERQESHELKYRLYEKLLNFMRNDLDGLKKEQGEVVAVLMMQAKRLPSSYVIKLIDSYLQYIESKEPLEGRWTELLSTLITLASSRDDLVVEGNLISGNDFMRKLLTNLCSYKWCSQTATTLLHIINELNLPDELLENVLNKVRKVLNEVEFQAIPPIIYHLIILGRGKFPGVILEIVMDYFNAQDENFKKKKITNDSLSSDITDIENSESIIEDSNSIGELIEAQSTAVVHIIHLAQYDPALVRNYMKILKTSTWLPQILFAHFNIALSLSLACIDRYKDQVIDSLKSSISKHYRQLEKQKGSFWLREAFKDNFDPNNALKATVNNCKGVWDQVNEGLVYLCFSLLECGSGSKADSYTNQHCAALASNVLPLILKKETHLAPGILKQLSGLILTAASPILYVELVGRLVKVAPVVLLHHTSIIMELLEQLEYLPLDVTTSLLHSLLPLFKMSVSLKDALILILKKMLFSRRLESRQAAVQGFLQFLRHFRVMGILPSSQGSMSFSSAISQISADVHSSFNSHTNEALCIELLGVLRRCFSQQHQVKSKLYAGLYDVSRTNPKLCSNILIMLHQHLVTFIDKSQHTTNPIILQKAVSIQGDSVTLIEPVGELIGCVSQCKTWFLAHSNEGGIDEDDQEETASIVNEINIIFDILIEKLAYCDMDDLDFATASFSQATVAGKQNLLFAETMIAIYDALIEQNFYSGALNNEDKMKTMISLFKTQRKIVNIVRERSKTTASKKGEGSKSKGRVSASKASVNFVSILSLKMVSEVLRASIKGDEAIEGKCVEILRNNHDFRMYLMFVVDQWISSLKVTIPNSREKLLPYLKIVAPLLLVESLRCISIEDLEDSKEYLIFKGSLTTLYSFLLASVKNYKEKLPQIVRDISGKSPATPYNAHLHYIVKKCQKMLVTILKEQSKSFLMKEAVTLVQLINLLEEQMEPNAAELKEIYDWINQLCQDYAVENSALSDALLTLLFQLYNQITHKGKLAPDIAREIHYRLGDIEQDISVEECGVYKIITEISAHSAINILMNYCDNILSILELTIQKVKATVNSRLKVNDDLEQNICTKFASIIHSLHEIIKTSLPQGSSLDIVIKTTTKIYNILTMFVKYYLDYYKNSGSPQISEKFEKLVHASANLLKEHTYKMIKYVNNAYDESTKKQSVLRARANKETKLIPSLVYSMEIYERELIRLSEKSGVNLMANTKASTSRDFRINHDALKEKSDESEADEAPDSPQPKRKKVH